MDGRGLYGLSLGYKQIAAVILPYYLCVVYREKGREGSPLFTGTMLAAFLAFNLPFIVLSPASWPSAVLLPEIYPLLGVGQGVRMLSFFGHYQLPSYYFPAMERVTAIAPLIPYIGRSGKYSFLAFPIVILMVKYIG